MNFWAYRNQRASCACCLAHNGKASAGTRVCLLLLPGKSEELHLHLQTEQTGRTVNELSIEVTSSMARYGLKILPWVQPYSMLQRSGETVTKLAKVSSLCVVSPMHAKDADVHVARTTVPTLLRAAIPRNHLASSFLGLVTNDSALAYHIVAWCPRSLGGVCCCSMICDSINNYVRSMC